MCKAKMRILTSACSLVALAGCSGAGSVTITNVDRPVAACVEGDCYDLGTGEVKTWRFRWSRSIVSGTTRTVLIHVEDQEFPTQMNDEKEVELGDGDDYELSITYSD